MEKTLKEILYERLPTITLEELYGYINEIEGKYIRVQYHPQDNNIVILNYTELATYERRWNKYTMSARGLILDLTNVKDNGLIYILAKPFDKFPNYGLNEIEGYEDDIDFNQVESVMEKMDGSIGIGYFFNDEIHFATRGSFTSEQAIKAKEIWDKSYADSEDMKEYCLAPVTYLVEIIYPQNRVVVNYGNREELVLIGTNVLSSRGITDADYEHMQWEAQNLGMPIAKQYSHSLEDMLELKDKLSANEEGWIIRFKNGKRLKIKGDEYLDVHRAIYGLSDKAKVKSWAEDNIDDLILLIPEEFRDEIENLRDELDEQAILLHRIMHILYQQAIEVCNDRKEFALHVNSIISKEHRKFMFVAYDKKEVPMAMVKDYIYKNYEHYLEVIRWANYNDF